MAGLSEIKEKLSPQLGLVKVVAVFGNFCLTIIVTSDLKVLLLEAGWPTTVGIGNKTKSAPNCYWVRVRV